MCAVLLPPDVNQMCAVLLPLGVNPIAVNKYINISTNIQLMQPINNTCSFTLQDVSKVGATSFTNITRQHVYTMTVHEQKLIIRFNML
jgi:hypothetical protein